MANFSLVVTPKSLRKIDEIGKKISNKDRSNVLAQCVNLTDSVIQMIQNGELYYISNGKKEKVILNV